jgi:hypothetical protein
MECPDHKREPTIVAARHSFGKYSVFIALQMCVIDIESREVVQLQTPYLGDVVFVSRLNAGYRECRRGRVLSVATG